MRYLPFRRTSWLQKHAFYRCGAILRPQKRVIGWSTTILKLPNHDICRSGAILNPLKRSHLDVSKPRDLSLWSPTRTFLNMLSFSGRSVSPTWVSLDEQVQSWQDSHGKTSLRSKCTTKRLTNLSDSDGSAFLNRSSHGKTSLKSKYMTKHLTNRLTDSVITGSTRDLIHNSLCMDMHRSFAGPCACPLPVLVLCLSLACPCLSIA